MPLAELVLPLISLEFTRQPAESDRRSGPIMVGEEDGTHKRAVQGPALAVNAARSAIRGRDGLCYGGRIVQREGIDDAPY
jgi:hypothetical protein